MAENRDWLKLPRSVTMDILGRLGAVEILKNAQKVCMTWRRICKDDPAMWRSIDIFHKGDLWDMVFLEETVNFIKQAVDRSCGQLVDINIQFFASDDLLQYIAPRASQLRRLRLVCGFKISNLGGAAKSLPLLEELDIFGLLSAEDLGNVGRCCPNLKKLKYNNQALKGKYDGEALAIAETMPGLRHLQLIGNGLTNDGLEAIMDSCCQLESLDLSGCGYVRLQSGTLLERRVKQIRRRPLDFKEYVEPIMCRDAVAIYRPTYGLKVHDDEDGGMEDYCMDEYYAF